MHYPNGQPSEPDVTMVTQLAGQAFQVTLSRDDVGNWVATAARLLRDDGVSATTEAPCIRVVHPAKERALKSVFDLLHEVHACRPPPMTSGNANGHQPRTVSPSRRTSGL
jgi:hypothetical protein